MAEKIQALITDKETLLRDVSHELRSPLARIRVALALAQRRSNDPAQQDLARIEQETEKLEQLVGQILTLTRLRSAAIEHHVPVRLHEIVGEVVDNARFERPGSKIKLLSRDVAEIEGDPNELASAIENVLRNALIHSGGDVDVAIEQQTAGEIVVTIGDHGPGVPEPELKRLFEPFYRVDPSRDHKQSGYGLGLAIAARVIERHGGSIEARNKPEGGLLVTFRLPTHSKKH
jgi:two-component system sensor histidine kinase CpxA